MLRRSLLFSSLALALAISGCEGVQRSVSANQNSRVSIVVIHHTTSNFEDSYYVLTEPTSRPVSSHYLIPEPGDPTYRKSKLQVHQLVDENRRAWHAGVSHWGGKEGINDQSIGIELVNRTWCHASDESKDPATGYPERICYFPDFDDGQLALLTDLLDEILERHPDIRPTHIVGHSDVAPDRKIDPGQTLTAQFQTPEMFILAPRMREKMHVFASVDEADIGLVKTAKENKQPVHFTVDAYPEDQGDDGNGDHGCRNSGPAHKADEPGQRQGQR